jgi:penicillin amidase
VPVPGKKFPKGTARGLVNMADANITDETLEMAKEFLERMKKVPLFQPGDRGSNAWAVSGKHTLTGKPLVGGDGHLQATSPSIFYPAHVSFPGLNIQGVVVAGTGPGFPQGRNDHITWSSVHHRGDHTDFYQEQLVVDPSSPSNLSTVYQGELEHVIPIPDTYRYNVIGDGRPDNTEEAPAGTSVFGTEIPPATLIVPRHGPVVSIDMQAMSAISIQSTTLMPSRRNDAYDRLQKAKNFRQYEDALKLFGWGSYGFVYADEKGNIAYNVAGDIPIREDLQANTVNGLPPGFIRKGTGGNEWVLATDPLPYQSSKYELLPWDELPQILNPPAGFVVAANNDPAGVSLDNNLLNQLRPGGEGIYYLSRSYGNSPRAARLTQMIMNKINSSFPKLSLRYIQEMGASTVMIDAEIFVPYILQAYENATAAGADPMLAAVASDPRVAEAVARFRDWDFSSPTGIPEGYDASDDDGQLAEPTAEEIEASVACTIYSVTRGQMLKNTLDTVRNALMLPLPDDLDFGGLVSVSALRHLLDNFDENQGVGESGLDFFNVPGVSDAAARRDILLLKSVADSLDLLASDAFAPAFNNSTDQNDYRWGRLHRIVIAHPLDGDFDVPPAFGAFPPPLADLAGIPTDGGFGTPDAGRALVRAEDADAFMWEVLGAQRYAYSMSKHWSRGKLAIPGGVSGNPFSPFYVNLLPQYLTNDYFPVIMPRRLPRAPHARSHR